MYKSQENLTLVIVAHSPRLALRWVQQDFKIKVPCRSGLSSGRMEKEVHAELHRIIFSCITPYCVLLHLLNLNRGESRCITTRDE